MSTFQIRPRVKLLSRYRRSTRKWSAKCSGVICGFAHTHDLTILLVMHETRFAHEVYDRARFFDKGKFVEQVEPERIFMQPKHARTREILASVLG